MTRWLGRPASPVLLVLLVAAVLVGCSSSTVGKAYVPRPSSSPPDSIRLTSPAFADGGTIPVEFTCSGGDRSPPLRWTGVPGAAVELALVVDDPDAPGGTFVHWVLFALPPGDGGVEAGTVPPGARQGRNGFGKAAYGGPCPPQGDPPHHYRFVLYALSRKLDEPDGAPGEAVRRDAETAAIARGRLVGLYGRR